MTLRLHDTRTRDVRAFEPLVPGAVGVYVCGPTVQAAPHVGHLRSAVALDVLHRWLREKGLTVTWVRNVTDVDDKIIHDAAHAGEPWWALATRQERAFERAYDAVQVLPPTATPRVTGSVTSIVALVQVLVDKGAAYVSDGDVYLSVRAVPDYGSLSGQDPDALRATEKPVAHGHTGAKRDPLDFALWKAAKPGEPSWPSPWGHGRPGWHIECSAMAVEHLGEEFDLHAGGLDLVFPHHENEVAQSTSAGHAFARHWLHHGLVTVAGGTGEKMSKSLGNSTSVGDVLRTTRPQVLRYVLGAAHYRSALEWSPQAVADGEAAYERIETFVRNASEVLGDPGTSDHGPATGPAWDDFAAALDDDLAVPQALAVLHASVRIGNTLLAEGDRAALAATLADVRRMLTVLGLDPVRQWPTSGTDLAPVVDALVGLAVEARAEARAVRDWARADAVRDRLAAAGVVLEDTAAGVRWRLERTGPTP
jgi:cysteinyl-tRNA synthetase